MRIVGKSYWMGVSTDGEKAKAAVLSWLGPLCSGMTVQSAEIMCDVETDREKKLRVVLLDSQGKRRIATRTNRKGSYVITLKAA